jgi:hypothetical protein
MLTEARSERLKTQQVFNTLELFDHTGSRAKVQYYVRIAKSDYRDILSRVQLGPLAEAEGEKLQKQARALIAQWGKK